MTFGWVRLGMRLRVRDHALVVVVDDATEHAIDGVWLPSYWQRTPGDYCGEFSRWNEAYVHRADGTLWLRLAWMEDYDGADARRLEERCFRSIDGGRTWTGPAPTPREVPALPIVADLTTSPLTPPRPHWDLGR